MKRTLRSAQKGFTLIELMIVVAIIGILAAVALPQYRDYTRKSADNACLAEAKGFSNAILIWDADGASGAAPSTTAGAACTNYSTPTSGSGGTLTATAKTPGTASISCDENAVCTK